jgi:hypothetical protein
MAITRRSFTKGVMDKDTDERLLPDGVYRHAENVLVTNPRIRCWFGTKFLFK